LNPAPRQGYDARQAHDAHVQETLMPYNTVADLPKAQTDQYNPHQKKAFLEAFNNAYKEYKSDESRAFAVAHSAAKKAGEKPGPG
jgi:cation transport regulator